MNIGQIAYEHYTSNSPEAIYTRCRGGSRFQNGEGLVPKIEGAQPQAQAFLNSQITGGGLGTPLYPQLTRCID